MDTFPNEDDTFTAFYINPKLNLIFTLCHSTRCSIYALPSTSPISICICKYTTTDIQCSVQCVRAMVNLGQSLHDPKLSHTFKHILTPAVLQVIADIKIKHIIHVQTNKCICICRTSSYWSSLRSLEAHRVNICAHCIHIYIDSCRSSSACSASSAPILFSIRGVSNGRTFEHIFYTIYETVGSVCHLIDWHFGGPTLDVMLLLYLMKTMSSIDKDSTT